jgi:hypothetical protein
LKLAENDNARLYIARSILHIVKSELGGARFVAEGGCPVLVEVLKITESRKARFSIAEAFQELTKREDAMASVIAADGCFAIFDALKNANDDVLRFRFAMCLCRMSKTKQGSENLGRLLSSAARMGDHGCSGLVAALGLISLAEILNSEAIGSLRGRHWETTRELLQSRHVLECLVETRCCGVIVKLLKCAGDDETRCIVAHAIELLAQNDDALATLAQAGCCGALDQALTISSDGSTKSIIASAMKYFNPSDGELAAISVQSNMSDRVKTNDRTVAAILKLVQSDRGCAGVIAAGGCSALVEALKMTDQDANRVSIASFVFQCARGGEGGSDFTLKIGLLQIQEAFPLNCALTCLKVRLMALHSLNRNLLVSVAVLLTVPIIIL